MNKFPQMLDLYEKLLFIRLVEERIASEYSHQEMRCPVHLSIGQEAVPVGVSANLLPIDHVVSAHRSHAHYLAKGGNLRSMLCEIYGKADGCAGGKGGSMHLIDHSVNLTAAVPIVGSSISIGTGIGFGLKSAQNGAIVCVYFGDGATEEGAFSESLDFAAKFDLPVLFVCENNFFSVYTHIDDRQSPDRCLETICRGHGIEVFKTNGNDVLQVKEVSGSAIRRVREDLKPAILLADTYRWLEHCGPNWDDHLNYRDATDVQNWIDRCPLKSLSEKLHKLDENSSKLITDIKIRLTLEIDEAFSHAKSSSFPAASELYTNIYAESNL